MSDPMDAIGLTKCFIYTTEGTENKSYINDDDK